MNKIIKKISLVLTLVMLVLTIPFGTNIFAAEESVYSLSQGEEGLLRYLGIIDETPINYDKQITRGELAHIAAGVADIKDTAIEKQAFYDVEAEHKYYQEICALAQMGVVSGNGFGYFMPDSVVGDAEISKIFASILGYRETGHYGSYIGVAKSAGILDGVQMDNVVTYGEALEMAYNTLHCSMVEVFVSIDGSSVSYGVNEGFLALEYYHGLVMQKGILEGADGTELGKVNSKIELGTVLINDRIYKCSSADALLGQAVTFYTKCIDSRTGETSDVIEYIHASKKNDIFTVDPDDVILGETSYQKFVYYQNDVKKEVKLGANVKCIINGMAYESDFIANGKLKPNAGTITLIDNDFDKKYDVILIESYHYVLAKSVDDERGVIQYERDANGNAGEWNYSDRDEINMVVSDNGRKILPSSLTGGAPIVVKMSENTEGLLKIDVQPLRTVVEGPVEAMSSEYITVAGKRFTMANSGAFVQNVDRIKLNDNVQVYTHLGKCVAIVHSAGDEYVHGWLVGAWKETAAFSESLNFRIINRDKTMVDYVSKERLVIDNAAYNNVDTILTKLNEAARTMINYDAAYPQWQMIRYKLDSAGLVSHIDTVLAGTILSENELYGMVDSAMTPVTHSIETGKAEDQYLRDSYLGGNYYYISYTRSFYTDPQGELPQQVACTVPASYTSWTVPIDTSVRNNPDYYWASRSGGPDSQQTGQVEFYSVNEDVLIPKYAVFYSGVTETGSEPETSGRPSVVSGKCEVLTANDDVVTEIELISYNGTAATYTLAEHIDADSIDVGDLIFTRQNATGTQIIAVTSVWKYGDAVAGWKHEGSEATHRAKSVLRAYNTIGGTVLSMTDDVISFTTSSPDNMEKANYNHYVTNASTQYFIYNENDRFTKFKVGSAADLLTYDRAGADADEVIITYQNGQLNYVYIIKK